MKLAYLTFVGQTLKFITYVLRFMKDIVQIPKFFVYPLQF